MGGFEMGMENRGGMAVFFLALFLLPADAAWAQKLAERPRPAAMRSLSYDAARETTVEGTVQSYIADSHVPPIGAHVIVQTASGTIDVHLGAASFLQASHFSLAKGDSVKIVGFHSTTRRGSVFLARVIQKGGQSLILRTSRGAPLSLARSRVPGAQQTPQQEGAH